MGISLHDIIHTDLHNYIVPLDQALYNHEQWFNALIRTLICHLPPDQHDLSPTSYNECRFGQWYDTVTSEALRNHQGFIAIGKEHQHMHCLASQLLITNETTTISPLDYDSFSNSLARVRLEIFTLKRELEELLYNSDPLTRALNRVNMLPLLREQQELVKRKTQDCCIAMMDLDNFKSINDTYGHAAGDIILATAAQTVMINLRPYDKVFRYGGEEFVICMPHTNSTAALDIVERVRMALAQNIIDIGEGQKVHITASFGISILDSILPAEQSIDRADRAMYAAKKAGRNCTRAWIPELDLPPKSK